MSPLLNNTILIIDFDSTFTRVEALDELGKIVLEGNDKEEKLKAISDITNRGMSGELSFNESLKERMKILGGTRSDIESLISVLKTKVSHSIITNKDFFINNSNNIHIVSSGFKEFIAPVVAEFGISAENVHANNFIWENDTIQGFDPDNPLCNDKGKPKIVDSLQLKGTKIVIGDGYTDYEIKEAGMADLFIAYTENVTRPAVVSKADFIATNFNNFLNYIIHDKNIILSEA